MSGMYLAVAFSDRSPALIWMILMITLGLSGIAMLIFAKPFEVFSYRYPLWNRGESHSARFYRIMGTIWVLIAAVMAVPVVVILVRSMSR
jgi:magnesium-transporting ATPase (P-type)